MIAYARFVRSSSKRRHKAFFFPASVLLDIINGLVDGRDQIPGDAEIVGVDWDMLRGGWLLLVEHDSFEEVPEGMIAPVAEPPRPPADSHLISLVVLDCAQAGPLYARDLIDRAIEHTGTLTRDEVRSAIELLVRREKLYMDVGMRLCVGDKWTITESDQAAPYTSPAGM